MVMIVAGFLLVLGSEVSADPGIFLDEPVADAAIYENQSDLLIAWHSAGLRKVTLLRFATLNGFFDPGRSKPKTKELEKLLDQGDYEEIRRLGTPLLFEENLFGPKNFVQAAYRLGIVKEMIWVVPRGRSLTPENYEDLKVYYTDKVDAETGRTLHYSDGIIQGSFLDMPVRICSPGDIKNLNLGPVCIVVNTDFFTSLYENPTKRSLLGILSDTLQLLRSKRLEVVFTGITNTFHGGYSPFYHVYLQDVLLPIIKDPGLLDRPVDIRWITINEAFRLESLGMRDQAMAIMRRLSGDYPDYAYPLYFLATQHYRRQEDEKCMVLLRKAFEKEPSYIKGFIELSIVAQKAGQKDLSRQLLETAERLSPLNYMVLYMLGNTAVAENNCADAISYYERFTRISGEYSDITSLIYQCRQEMMNP